MGEHTEGKAPFFIHLFIETVLGVIALLLVLDLFGWIDLGWEEASRHVAEGALHLEKIFGTTVAWLIWIGVRWVRFLEISTLMYYVISKFNFALTFLLDEIKFRRERPSLQFWHFSVDNIYFGLATVTEFIGVWFFQIQFSYYLFSFLSSVRMKGSLPFLYFRESNAVSELDGAAVLDIFVPLIFGATPFLTMLLVYKIYILVADRYAVDKWKKGKSAFGLGRLRHFYWFDEDRHEFFYQAGILDSFYVVIRAIFIVNMAICIMLAMALLSITLSHNKPSAPKIILWTCTMMTVFLTSLGSIRWFFVFNKRAWPYLILPLVFSILVGLYINLRQL